MADGRWQKVKKTVGAKSIAHRAKQLTPPKIRFADLHSMLHALCPLLYPCALNLYLPPSAVRRLPLSFIIQPSQTGLIYPLQYRIILLHYKIVLFDIENNVIVILNFIDLKDKTNEID
jgi:hypothetical protein